MDVSMYAAYGSNMEPSRMAERAPHSPMSGTGWLEGWRLTFGGENVGIDGALGTIVEAPGSRVFVVLYDVTSDDEHEIDRWEGQELGIRTKIHLRVQTMDGSALTWLYVLDDYEGGLPSAHYIGLLANAAEAAGAPADYVNDIRTHPCHNVGP